MKIDKMKDYNILTINPGSTSTKVAVFKNRELLLELTLRHCINGLSKFPTIIDQFDFRKEIIINAVKEAGIELNSLDVVIGRGGLIKSIPSGVYEVNEALKADLLSCDKGEHASNLGGLIADDIAKSIGVKAYIADPVVVDEMCDVAKVTGIKGIERRSIFHALNQKAISRQYAEEIGREYEDLNLIVAHMGGGVSVGAHHKGQIIDVNNALNGDGPFSPERAGSIPAGQLVELCFSGKYTHDEINKLLCGNGGFLSLIGTNDSRDLTTLIQGGDKYAKLILDAFSYNVCKSIGAMFVALEGRVDAIILTGGVANNPLVCEYMLEKVNYIAPIVIKPGENELEALAFNALFVLEGKVEPKIYK